MSSAARPVRNGSGAPPWKSTERDQMARTLDRNLAHPWWQQRGQPSRCKRNPDLILVPAEAAGRRAPNTGVTPERCHEEAG